MQRSPDSGPQRGLKRVLAASYIGIGTTKFDEMVDDGLMPKPRLIGRRKIWDIQELDRCFDELPQAGDNDNNPWDEID